MRRRDRSGGTDGKQNGTRRRCARPWQWEGRNERRTGGAVHASEESCSARGAGGEAGNHAGAGRDGFLSQVHGGNAAAVYVSFDGDWTGAVAAGRFLISREI